MLIGLFMSPEEPIQLTEDNPNVIQYVLAILEVFEESEQREREKKRGK
jgi:hypothetical protein